jgi:hypothetical protein
MRCSPSSPCAMQLFITMCQHGLVAEGATSLALISTCAKARRWQLSEEILLCTIAQDVGSKFESKVGAPESLHLSDSDSELLMRLQQWRKTREGGDPTTTADSLTEPGASTEHCCRAPAAHACLQESCTPRAPPQTAIAQPLCGSNHVRCWFWRQRSCSDSSQRVFASCATASSAPYVHLWLPSRSQSSLCRSSVNSCDRSVSRLFGPFRAGCG